MLLFLYDDDELIQNKRKNAITAIKDFIYLNPGKWEKLAEYK
jgi:hypothetical protein